MVGFEQSLAADVTLLAAWTYEDMLSLCGHDCGADPLPCKYNMLADLDVQGNRLYVVGGDQAGAFQRLHVLDITNPGEPRCVGSQKLSCDGYCDSEVSVNACVALGVLCYGGHVYLGTGAGALAIVDLGTLDANSPASAWTGRCVPAEGPSVWGKCQPGDRWPGDTEVLAVNEIEGRRYLYTAACHNPLIVFDITDPGNPRECLGWADPQEGSCQNSQGHDVTVLKNHVFVLEGATGLPGGDLNVLTMVHDGGIPRLTHRGTLKEAFGSVGADAQHGILCTVGEYGLKVFEMEKDLGKLPVLKGCLAADERFGLPANVVLSGQYAYVADRRHGLQVVAIADRTSPRTVTRAAAPIPDMVRMAVKSCRDGDLVFVGGTSATGGTLQVFRFTFDEPVVVSRHRHRGEGVFDMEHPSTGCVIRPECRFSLDSQGGTNHAQTLSVAFGQPRVLASERLAEEVRCQVNGVAVTPGSVFFDGRLLTIEHIPVDCSPARLVVTVGGTLAMPWGAAVSYLAGDVNGDGIVDGQDLAVVRAKLDTVLNKETYRLDVNTDGRIDAKDLDGVRMHLGQAILQP